MPTPEVVFFGVAIFDCHVAQLGKDVGATGTPAPDHTWPKARCDMNLDVIVGNAHKPTKGGVGLHDRRVSPLSGPSPGDLSRLESTYPLTRFSRRVNAPFISSVDDVLMAEIIFQRGRSVLARSRPPKAVDGRRLCTEEECETVLSRYNKRLTCSIHTPTHFPRNRGRKRKV